MNGHRDNSLLFVKLWVGILVDFLSWMREIKCSILNATVKDVEVPNSLSCCDRHRVQLLSPCWVLLALAHCQPPPVNNDIDFFYGARDRQDVSLPNR